MQVEVLTEILLFSLFLSEKFPWRDKKERIFSEQRVIQYLKCIPNHLQANTSLSLLRPKLVLRNLTRYLQIFSLKKNCKVILSFRFESSVANRSLLSYHTVAILLGWPNLQDDASTVIQTALQVSQEVSLP